MTTAMTLHKTARTDRRPFAHIRASLRLTRWFARAYPLRGAASVTCLLLAGLLEGVGIAALLPLVGHILGAGGSETTLGRGLEAALARLGVEPGVGAILFVIVVALTLKSALNLLAMAQVGFSASDVTRDMRRSLITALMAVRWNHLTAGRTGDYTAALGSEAGRAATSYLQVCRILAGAIQVVVYLSLAFMLSWIVTIAAIAIGFVTVLILSRLVTIARRSGEAQSQLMRTFTSRLIDGIGMMKPLRAMGAEQQLLPLLDQDIEGLNRAQRRNILSAQAMHALQEPIIVVAIALGLFLMLDTWSGPLETLFALVILFNRTVTRVGALQRNYQGLARSEPAFWFVRGLTRTVEVARDTEGGLAPAAFSRDLRLDNVTFRYLDADILSDVSLVIPAQRVVAITGRSGAGKTTLVDLIVGLMQPTTGGISVDGVPLSNIRLAEWRSLIGYVPQETYLFHDTIAENIRLGDRSIDLRAVEHALRRAEALDFVNELPHGLETVAGERGQRFSGGQRQRLAIARALVRNPRLLVLDESTASLDDATERDLVRTLRHLSTDMTVLAISHQPALVDAADVVVRVEDGTAAISTVPQASRKGQRASLSVVPEGPPVTIDNMRATRGKLR